ncbi:MAG TPA: aspartate kinase [Longimicrobium sp.]|nr:aspartate kinase [Longimicrobium sp.]
MLVVQKYGGTSVGSHERIQRVARRVANARRRGDDLVVVVSAMGDTTDDLTTLAQLVTGRDRPQAEHAREMDMLLTAGERIASALLTMAIREQGVEARSFTGSQAAIETDSSHTAARITNIRGDRIRDALREGCVAIVAGFQGVSKPGNEITTLGRGGSDTSAVALAAKLGADQCEIYTDVDGIYTADPRRVPDARIIPVITHEEMLEMASSGAQVMHGRAVDIGGRFGVDIRVLSSFVDDDDGRPRGTLITSKDTRMEDLVLRDVTGLASKGGQAKLVLRGLEPGMRTQTELLEALAGAGVSVDMVVEAFEADGRMQVQLTVADDDVETADAVAREVAEKSGGHVAAHRGLSRIAMVGHGMTGRPGVYARAYRALMDHGVEVHGVSTSSTSITVLVPKDREEDAVRALHAAFELGKG